MQVAKHEQLVKSIEKTAGEKLTANQLDCHVEYSRACHQLEKRMQVMQKRNPVMLAAEEKTEATDTGDENIDSLGVQEMKEFKIFKVERISDSFDWFRFSYNMGYQL